MKINFNTYNPAFRANPVNIGKKSQICLTQYEIFKTPELKTYKVFNSYQDFELMEKVNKTFEKIREDFKIKSQNSRQNSIILDRNAQTTNPKQD